MKIALLFLLCFISATWQQNMFWSYPPRLRIPFYSMFNHNLQENSPVLAASDPGLPFHYSNDEIEQRNMERSPVSNFYQRLQKPAESRAFGLNYLASIILSSLTLSSTSTSYTTTTSTITAATVLTCFTKTMFTSTTACRRKRDAVPNLLIGNSEDEHFNAPSGGEIVATNPLELPGEGRNIDPSQLIVSSRNEEFGRSEEFVPADLSFDRYFRNYRNVIVSFTVTSTLTSYSVYYSPSTRTVTNLAAETALSCLPSGFTLC